MNGRTEDHARAGANSTGRVALGWALVGVPLVYGVVETLVRVSKLFAT